MRTKKPNYEREVYTAINERIHKNIRYLLDYHGMTMKELATKAGVSYDYIVSITSAHNRTPSFPTLHKISESLETTIERIILHDIDGEFRKMIESKLLEKQN